MRPETWRKPLESPTDAAGTERLTCTSALSPGGTVICVGETVMVCGEPARGMMETVNVAGDEPRFSSENSPSRAMSRVDSTTPKLTLGEPPSVCAMTDDLVAEAGCTRPLPPRRAE